MTEQSIQTSRGDDEPGNASNASRTVNGCLRGEISLTVQTVYAQSLIRGREASLDKPAIVGLFGFADRSRVIWHAARADDPFADWWLIKIDEALDRARHRIDSEQAMLEHCLERQSLLEVHVATSEQRYRVALQFSNPYAYWGAHLVAMFDQAARTLATAKQIGVLSGAAADRSLMSCGRTVRGLFCVPQGYRQLHVDRASIREGGDAARKAIDSMGDLPNDVLSGTRKAPLAPRCIVLPKSSGLSTDDRQTVVTP